VKQQSYFTSVLEFANQQKKIGKIIYPPTADIFNAFLYTPLSDVKVVILGQDPYHGPGQAHGLAFSVRPGIPIPPSLGNIFKELRDDIGIDIPKTGYLKPWAEQGVFLLNTVLTVEQGHAHSHANRGWEEFTDQVITVLSDSREHVVFLLWGKHAESKENMIDQERHLILKAPHPSPLSAHRGFMGCKHFSKANEYLQQHNQVPIDWQL
jgi:uracil-DNA glycosylase